MVIEEATFLAVTQFVLLLLFISVALIRRSSEFEKKWYLSRALAESIKTTTWRYSMGAAPFGPSKNAHDAAHIFRNFLAGILKTNRSFGSVIWSSDVDSNTVTQEMTKIRLLSVSDKLDFYKKFRLVHQKEWYRVKSRSSRNRRNVWFVVMFIVAMVLLTSFFLDRVWSNLLETSFDPLLVLLTGLIGWVEVKRFGEISASYSMTSHEIDTILLETSRVQDEESLSEFVNEAERAFSREHTQWLARTEAVQ